MNELALFAGAGGGILGGHLLGWRTVAAVEIGDYPRRVLLQRQADGILPRFPIWDDVCTFDGKPWRGKVDVVSGGFPCQAFSKAKHGIRTSVNLWPEMLRIVKECCPRFVFAENVAEEAIAQAGVDLFREGYAVRYAKISAKDLGADHKRDRWWLVAHSDLCGELLCKFNDEAQGMQKLQNCIWGSDPNESRMVNGVADRLDRLKASGNGQVPIVAAFAWKILGENTKDMPRQSA